MDILKFLLILSLLLNIILTVALARKVSNEIEGGLKKFFSFVKKIISHILDFINFCAVELLVRPFAYVIAAGIVYIVSACILIFVCRSGLEKLIDIVLDGDFNCRNILYMVGVSFGIVVLITVGIFGVYRYVIRCRCMLNFTEEEAIEILNMTKSLTQIAEDALTLMVLLRTLYIVGKGSHDVIEYWQCSFLMSVFYMKGALVVFDRLLGLFKRWQESADLSADPVLESNTLS